MGVESAIRKKLRDIEKKHGVKVLYAVESGSRAWGFASRDSDYDVRFIYVHPRDWYLSIETQSDVIELPLENELDTSGWDLTKALRLFRKSNPSLYEWLQSPIVYVPPHPSIKRLKKLIPVFFSPKTCLWHYLSMADNNLKDDAGKLEIRPKKYFYILRPVFACDWIKKFDSMPPTEFDRLFQRQELNRDLRRAIRDLLADKKAGREQDLQPRIQKLDDYARERIDSLRAYALKMEKAPEPSYEPFNKLFRQTLAGEN